MARLEKGMTELKKKAITSPRMTFRRLLNLRLLCTLARASTSTRGKSTILILILKSKIWELMPKCLRMRSKRKKKEKEKEKEKEKKEKEKEKEKEEEEEEDGEKEDTSPLFS